MSFASVAKVGPIRRLLYRLALWRVREKLVEIGPHLGPADRVLDVGAGNCVLCQQLRLRGVDVTPLDLANLSFVEAIEPVVYDGKTLPFDDDRFDVALIITVLHHTHDPDRVLAEVARVARRIVIVEEIYESRFEKHFTYAIDSLFNLEFFGHPRSNRTDAGWKAAFSRLGLEVSDATYTRSLRYMRRVTYVLGRAGGRVQAPALRPIAR